MGKGDSDSFETLFLGPMKEITVRNEKKPKLNGSGLSHIYNKPCTTSPATKAHGQR